MKKMIGVALCLGAMVAVTGCSTVSSSNNHVIYGVVADTEANPVPGAIVTSTPPTESVSTDKEGRYMIKSVKAGEYTLQANKMGYVSTPAKISARGANLVQGDIRMVPEELIPAPTQVYVEPATEEAVASPAPTAAVSTESGAEDTEKGSKAWWEKK